MIAQYKRQLVRLAVAIHQRLQDDRPAFSPITLPIDRWRECQATVHKLVRAQSRGWHVAASQILENLRHHYRQLQYELANVGRVLETPLEKPVVSLKAIYQDLVAMYDEFESVSFDVRGKLLSVDTEPIELEGVYLGPFRIELELQRLHEGQSGNYRVIALDEHPASSHCGVTHPHVQDESLCEGDGQQAIKSALSQGRLLDFFLIVANLLRTYSSSSPYVSLTDWYGVDCVDCGSTVSDDERSACGKCEEYICHECCSYCNGCERDYCTECISLCDGCDERHCRGCLSTCTECDGSFCPSCLNDQERCKECHEQETQEDAEGQAASSGGDSQPDVTVHPAGLGQAVVSAGLR